MKCRGWVDFPWILAPTECGRPKDRLNTPVHRGAVFYLARTVRLKLHRAPIRRCGTRLGRELRLGVGRRLDAREGAPLHLGCEICGLVAVGRLEVNDRLVAQSVAQALPHQPFD